MSSLNDIEERGVAPRCSRLGHAARSSRQDDTDRTACGQRCGGHVERKNLAVDGELAKPACDELSVLGTEIEDDYGLMRHAVVSEAAGAVERRIAS